VTTPARRSVTVSLRLIAPVPVEVPLLLVETSELALTFLLRNLGRLFSSPKRLGMPMFSLPVRPALDWFFRSASSVMLTSTVTMSPTLAARWSLKNARLP